MRVNQFPIFLRRAVSAAAGGGATLVQTSGAKSVVNVGAGAYTFAMPGNITAGNTVIICGTFFKDDNIVPSGASMVVSGTACVLDSSKQSTANGSYFICIFRATNVTGGTPNLVFTSTAGTNYVTLSMEEWSNFNASPVDSVPTPTQTTATSNSITSGTTAQANEVVYAASNCTLGNQAGFTGPSSGFTQSVLDTGGTNLPVAAGYKKVTSTGTFAANFTITASVETSCVLVTYKTP